MKPATVVAEDLGLGRLDLERAFLKIDDVDEDIDVELTE